MWHFLIVEIIFYYFFKEFLALFDNKTTIQFQLDQDEELVL